MFERPSVKLFGVPELALPGARQALVFTTERPFQVLVFLCAHARWVKRDELGALLWPERSAAQARSNLRKVLLLARQLPGVGAIEQQGDLLRWLPETDLGRFDSAFDNGSLDAAVTIGAEPFLQGMEDGLPGEGAEWILFERKRLEERWRAACLRRLEALDAASAEAVGMATAMLRRDPLDEAATLVLARAQAARGARAPALQTLRDYAGRLKAELAVEPSLDWQRTARALESGAADEDAGGQRALAEPAPRAASAAEALIGRRAERAQVARLLEEPACRALTLTGFAGMGKSALAHAVFAHAAADDPGSANWVPLEDLTAIEHVPLRLAAALGVALSGGREPWAQVVEALGDRPLLVVLDNAEHLDLADAVGDLLGRCAGVKVLSTSRGRLGVVGEWLLPVDGLPIPDEDEDDVEVLRHCDAVRLFEARARPFVPSFDLAVQAGAVARLVRLLGGSPLAIGLAAARTRVQPVEEIAAELAESIERLDDDAPERSVRSGFEQAWQLLSAREQECAARLAWLPGDFGRAMAGQVADAPLPVLASLVDKSFLRCDAAGRFSMHPLIRQWTAPRAADRERVLDAHGSFVGRWLGRHAAPGGGLDRAVMAEIDRELAHVRAATRRAVARGDDALIADVARPVSLYYERRGLWREGLGLFEDAVAALDGHAGGDAGDGAAAAAAGADDGEPAPRRGLATAVRALGVLQYRSGRLVDAERSAHRLLALADALADSTLTKAALNLAGLAAWQQGRFAEAREPMAAALRLAVDDGDLAGRRSFTSNLAMIDTALGRYDDALAGYAAGLAFDRSAADMTSVVTSLSNLANVHRARGTPAEALPQLAEALAICDRETLPSSRPFVLVNLGLVHEELGHDDVAAGFLARALEETRRHGEPLVEADALLAQARFDLAAARFDAARAKTAQALAIADRLPSAPTQIGCVFSYGAIVAAEGRPALGAAAMRWAIEQPALDRPDRDRSARRLAALGLAPAAAIAPTTPLAEVVARLLPAAR